MSAHEWLEVGDRRWCLGCDLFQVRPKGHAFFPTPRKPCPRNTPYAQGTEVHRTATREHSGGER